MVFSVVLVSVYRHFWPQGQDVHSVSVPSRFTRTKGAPFLCFTWNKGEYILKIAYSGILKTVELEDEI